MIYESYFVSDSENSYLIHSKLVVNRPSLLFIHGLGDSHIDFRSYLFSNLAEQYNILIPDLLGYGKSSMARDYSFDYQIQRLISHLKYLENNYDLEFSNLFLIAHSMGGMHATLLCESSLKNNIKGFINVEGSVTQFGSFVADSMMQAIKKIDFNEWYEDFKQHRVYATLALQNPAIRPYYASLEFCDPNAFQQNAREMYEMDVQLTGKYTNVIGKKYCELSIPKVYCYGNSLCQETIDFLNEHKLKTQYFPSQSHFLLSECFHEMVIFINEFVNSIAKK